ncbi:MAG TPA: hypothetical protein VLG71_02355, partial [Candidatus Limnocylindria bacterium]|nr:hypothetical protein [Candidatus Limnocylindria bacterium]
MVKLKWLFIGIMMLGHGVFYGQTHRHFFDDLVPACHYKNTLAVSMQLVAELEDCDDSKVAERIALLGALVQVLRAQEQQ